MNERNVIGGFTAAVLSPFVEEYTSSMSSET